MEPLILLTGLMQFQGNGSSDTARTYLYFMMNGQKDLAESYLKKVCIKTDVAKQYIQQWLPVVAAVQLSRNIDGEAEFLMSWLDIISFE